MVFGPDEPTEGPMGEVVDLRTASEQRDELYRLIADQRGAVLIHRREGAFGQAVRVDEPFSPALLSPTANAGAASVAAVDPFGGVNLDLLPVATHTPTPGGAR